MKKADYEYYIDDDKIYIIDLNLGSVSVTNDAENVLSEILPDKFERPYLSENVKLLSGFYSKDYDDEGCLTRL